MNRIRATMAATALLAGLTSTCASAQTTTPRLDQRQARQDQRIEGAVDKGALTTQEAARLEKGQEHLSTMESKASADGQVTRKERARLEHAADKQSRHIARQAHDGQHDRNHDGKNDRRQRTQKKD